MPLGHLGFDLGYTPCTFSFAVIFKCEILNKAEKLQKITKQGHSVADWEHSAWWHREVVSPNTKKFALLSGMLWAIWIEWTETPKILQFLSIFMSRLNMSNYQHTLTPFKTKKYTFLLPECVICCTHCSHHLSCNLLFTDQFFNGTLMQSSLTLKIWKNVCSVDQSAM